MRSGQLARRRAQAQRIGRATFTKPEQAVAWLGALQAQDYLGALWAVGLRVKGATEQDVERAIAERRIVRTWPMRGTLHFVAAEDARWITELLAPRRAAGAAARLRSYGIDDDVLSRARRALIRKLEGGKRLTRPAAYRVLGHAGIAADDQRGLHILWRLAHECLVCFGPREGKQHTFVLFDEWLPGARSLPRDEALPALARRYFTSHGPATLRDFVWWSGLPVGDARRAVQLAGDALQEEAIGAERYFSCGGARREAPSDGAVHVLPAFDEILVGYTDRSAAVDAAHLGKVCSGGVIRPVVVRGGRVLGTWGRRIDGHAVACTVAPFGRVSVEQVKRALGCYARFLGLELRA
jgi:hypothetical protein